jgi:hypothetical protein
VILITLSACGEEKPHPKTVAEKLLDLHPHLPFVQVIYHSDALPGQKAYMSDRLRSLLYDEGRERELPEFARVEEYAVCLSGGIYGMEIHIFRMKSRSDARNMEAILWRRARLMKRRSLYLYRPEAYETYLCTAQVYTVGKYVLLLSTGENGKILSRIKSMIG